MLITGNRDIHEPSFFRALGMTNQFGAPPWPLPNMKPATEIDFWRWRSTYSFELEAHEPGLRIEKGWRSLFIFYANSGHYIGGGFAVLADRSYQKESVEYFSWRACEHEFKERNVGKCLHRYTCAKCAVWYELDSSG